MSELAQGFKDLMTDANREKFEQQNPDHASYTITYKGKTKRYTGRQMQMLKRAYASKVNGSQDFAQQAFASYTDSDFDRQAYDRGLPSLKLWSSMESYAADGGVQEKYGHLQDEDWQVIKGLWTKDWQYGLSTEDAIRQLNGQAPVEYDSMYTDTLLDDELKAAGLPPAKLLNGKLAEKYSDYLNQYGEHVAFSQTRDDFYNDVADKLYRAELTGVKRGSEDWNKIFFDTLSSDKYAGLWDYYKAPAAEAAAPASTSTKTLAEQILAGNTDTEIVPQTAEEAFAATQAERQKAAKAAAKAAKTDAYFDNSFSVADFLTLYEQNITASENDRGYGKVNNAVRQAAADIGYTTDPAFTVSGTDSSILVRAGGSSARVSGSMGSHGGSSGSFGDTQTGSPLDQAHGDATPIKHANQTDVAATCAKLVTDGFNSEEYWQVIGGLTADEYGAGLVLDSNTQSQVAAYGRVVSTRFGSELLGLAANGASAEELTAFVQNAVSRGATQELLLGAYDAVMAALGGADDTDTSRDWDGLSHKQRKTRDSNFKKAFETAIKAAPSLPVASGYRPQTKEEVDAILAKRSQFDFDEKAKEYGLKTLRKTVGWGGSDYTGTMSADELVASVSETSDANKAAVDRFREDAVSKGYSNWEVDQYLQEKGYMDGLLFGGFNVEHYREYLLETVAGDPFATEYINSISESDLELIMMQDTSTKTPEDAWTMAPAIMLTRGLVSYVASFVNFADMLAYNNSGSNQTGEIAEGINRAQAILSSVYKRDNQSALVGVITDAGSELVRMYLTAQTGNAVGSALGKAFSWTSGGATIGQVLGDTKIAQGAAKLIEWGAESIPFVTGAMGSSYAEARSKGATNQEAAVYGVLAGVVEGLTEKVSLEVLIGNYGNKLIGKVLKSGTNKLLTGPLAINTIKLACNALTEASQEGSSYILDLLLEKAIFNKDARFSWREFGEQAGMGALTGALGLALQNYNATYVQALMDFGTSSSENMQTLMNYAMNMYGVNVGTDGNYIVKSEDYDESKILSRDALTEAWRNYLDANESLRAAQTQYETAIASLDEDDAEKARQVIYWKNQISALDADDPASAKALSNAMEQLVIAERAQADTEKKNERLRAEARKALTESRQRGQRIMADASGAIRGHSRSMVAATLNVAGDNAAMDSGYDMTSDDARQRFDETKAYTAAVSDAITALDELERASAAQREAKAALYGTAVATLTERYSSNPVVQGALRTVNDLAMTQEAEAVRLEQTADALTAEAQAAAQREEQRNTVYQAEIDSYDSWYDATIDAIDAEEQEAARAAANGEITAKEYEAAKARAAQQIAAAMEARDAQRRAATLAYAGAGGESGGLSALASSMRLEAAEARAKADSIRNAVVRALAMRTQDAAFAALDEILTGEGVLTVAQREALSNEMNRIIGDALGNDAAAQQIYDAIATAEAAAQTEIEAEAAPTETASEAAEPAAQTGEQTTKLTPEQRQAELQKAQALGKMLGVDVRIADDLPDVAAGRYSNGVLYINKNADNAPMRVLVHELTHYLEGTSAYERLEQYVFGTLGGEPGFNAETEIASYRTLYAEARAKMGQDPLSDADAVAEARAEIVARWCEKNLFTNEASIQRLSNSQQSLAKRILNSIQSMLSGKRADPSASTLLQAEKLYIKALHAAKAFHGGQNDRYSVVSQFVASGMYVEPDGDGLTVYRVRFDKKGNRTTQEELIPNYDDPVNGPVTTDDILNHSPIGAFVKLGQKHGTLGDFSPAELEALKENGDLRGIPTENTSTAGRMINLMTDIANMSLAYKDNNFVWSMIGGYVFSAITSNSDPQYSRSNEFGTICRKTQNLVTAMSNAMKTKGRGLYAEEIIELQNRMINGSNQVDAPCSMCYVFSRWLGLGGYLNRIKVYQDRYAAMTPEQVRSAFEDVQHQLWSIIHPAAGEGNYEALVRDLAAKHGLNAEDYLQDLKRVGIAKSNNRYGETGWVNATGTDVAMSEAKERSTQLMEDAQLYARLLEDCLESYDGKNIRDENRRKAYEEIQQRMDLTDAYGWLTKVIFNVDKAGNIKFRKTATSDGKTWNMAENGAPSFVVPTDVLFDLNASDTFAKDYPEVWGFRTAGGPSLGKATYGYTDARLGEFTYGASVKNVKSQAVPKAPRYGVADQSTRKALPKNKLSYVNWNGEFDKGGEKAFLKAMDRIKAQAHKGGERSQSSSDFTSKNALDYLLTAFEMQCLGASMQTYSKVPEGISFFSAIGGSNNISCIGKGKGYEGTPTWTFDTEAGRYRVDPGSAELSFSTIQGVDPEVARMLSTVNNSSQINTVAMNREHAALLGSTPWIHMMIPVHMSGGTVENVSARAVAQGDPALQHGDINDATDCQTDKVLTRKELAAMTNEDGSRKYSAEDISMMMQARAIRKAVLLGQQLTAEQEAMIDTIDARFTRGDQLLRNMIDNYRARGIKLEAENGVDSSIGVQVYPVEYWDRTSTIENADINGDRFQTYCEMLGLLPRFSYGNYGEQGSPSDPDYYPGFHRFAGYYKALIDREMYNTWGPEAGTYRDNAPVDISQLTPGMLNGTEATSAAARIAEYLADPENRERFERHMQNTYDRVKRPRPNYGAYMYDSAESAKLLQQESAAAQVGRDYGAQLQDNAVEAKQKHDRLMLNSDVEARLAELRKQYGSMTTSGTETAPGRENVVLPNQTNDDTYVRRAAQTFMRAQTVTDAAASQIGQAVLRGEYDYERQTNAESQSRAEQLLVDLGGHAGALEYLKNVARGHAAANAETVALGEQLILDAMQSGDTNAFEEAVAYTALIGTTAGQTTQAFSMISKLSPQGVALYLHKVIEHLNNVEYKQLIAKGKMKPIELTEEQTARILGVKSFSEATAVQTQILEEIGAQIPLTVQEQLRNWRYLCMLGNVRTNVRNVCGNLAMATMRMQRDVVAAGFEALDVRRGQRLMERAAEARRAGDIEKAEQLVRRADRHLTQADRTKALALGPEYQANKAYAEGTLNDAMPMLKGDGKDTGLSALRSGKRDFNNKVLNRVSKFALKPLDVMDVKFLRPLYVNSYAQWMTSRGLTADTMTLKQRGEAMKYAVSEAQKATFRDPNWLATKLTEIRSRNLATEVLVGGVMPFAKTPANVLRRGIEYSPGGLLEGIAMLHKANASEGMSRDERMALRAQAIDRLASGTTGTGMLAIGMLLAKLGLLRVKDEDDRVNKFEKDMGEQDYSFKIGSVTMTLDWLAPMNMPMFMGAKIWDVAQQLSEGEEISFKDLAEPLLSIADPMIEMSLLSGIQSALKTYGSENALSAIAANTAQNFVGQFYPTIGGQLARTIDLTRRQPDTKQYWIQSMMAKIPGLSKLVKPYVGGYGEEEVYDAFDNPVANYTARAVEQFVLPGYLKIENREELTKELTRVYDSTGVSAFLPSKPSDVKSINLGKDYGTVALTPEQQVEYEKLWRQTAAEALRLTIKAPAYAGLSDADKADLLTEVYSEATKAARKQYKLKLITDQLNAVAATANP